MSVTLSLHKANKLRQLVIKDFRKLSLPKGCVSFELRPSDTLEEVKQRISQNTTKTVDNEKLFFELLEFEAQLKKEIFKANCTSGVSDLIEDITLLKNKIKVSEDIEDYTEGLINAQEIDLEKQFELVSKAEDSYFSKSLSFKSGLEPLNKSSLVKDLRKLEDKCNELNATVKISVNMSEFLKEKYGF